MHPKGFAYRQKAKIKAVNSIIILIMVVTNYKWTIEKWHELVNSGVLDGQKVELLEQEIVCMSPEGVEHSYTNENVVIYLRNLLSGLARVRESHPITLDNSEPEPDIAIVRLPETIYRNHHPYAEDIYWLIEVSNRTLTKDLEQKRCDPALCEAVSFRTAQDARALCGLSVNAHQKEPLLMLVMAYQNIG